MLGQERRVHLGLGTKAQMNTPFLGHVGAMLGSTLGLCWYVPAGSLTFIYRTRLLGELKNL